MNKDKLVKYLGYVLGLSIPLLLTLEFWFRNSNLISPSPTSEHTCLTGGKLFEYGYTSPVACNTEISIMGAWVVLLMVFVLIERISRKGKD